MTPGRLPPSPSAKTNFLWIAVSLLVLLPCLYYGYVANFPRLSFERTSSRWQVITADPCPQPGRCVQVGDRVLSIGHVDLETFRRNRSLNVLDGFGPDGTAVVRVVRGGREMTVKAFRYYGFRSLRVDSLTGLLPLIFWLMGTVAVLFLRPRDERWLVLVLCSYVTALWFSSGLASSRHAGGSSYVFHFFIWLFLPLSVHLHAILPNNLLRHRMRLLVPLYAGSVLLLLLDQFELLMGIERAYIGSFVAAVVLPPLLLLLRLFLPVGPAVRQANRIMLYGVALGYGPIALFFVVLPPVLFRFAEPAVDAHSFYPWVVAISLVAIPIMPMSYIYAIYKHHLGALELRANRLLGVYSFFSLYVTFYLLTLFFISSRWAPEDPLFFTAVLLASLAFVSVAPFLRVRFQELVDRHVFGIRHTPEEVIGIVSERIATAFDRTILTEVIVDEILPTLLIRQSALYLLGEPQAETLYEHGLAEPGAPPTAAEMHTLLARSGRYLDPQRTPERPRPWVRLVLPLALQGETLGVWLIGRRDPDDFFPAADIHLLSTIANQVAAVLENIRLYEQAQQEISQRKSAEQEIRRSEERFRNLFEATLEGIAIVRGDVILEVNHSLLPIFGYSRAEELIGSRLSELVPEVEDLSEETREGVGRQRDGGRVAIELAAKKYVFQGEDVTVVAIRDITRRKRDEAENKMLQRQLLHSQKMEAIGRLSAGVAHDFNNCLLAIFGYSDMLLAQHREDDLLTRNLSGIKDAAQKAAGLTRQLLTFARRQPLETRVMDMNQVVSGLEKMLRRLIGEDIELVTLLGSGLPQVKIDPGQMEQVLLNLAVNARHAMPDGGRLTLRTEPGTVSAAAPAPHGDVPPGSYVVLSVRDTGVGMEPEILSRIFEPFFTTKEVGEGTGLGLSTAYGIVKQSGGHIFVDSAPGQGACFTVYIPATRDEQAEAGMAARPWPDRGTETILLVEDEQEVRAMLHQILLGKGYRVLQAGSGEEALLVAGRYPDVIHLLLTDVIMPRLKGPDLAARLVAARPQTRVLYMSGYNEEAFPATSANVICLQKPFSPQTLAQTVRTVLDAPGAARAAAG